MVRPAFDTQFGQHGSSFRWEVARVLHKEHDVRHTSDRLAR
jgi:hypothetical protein